MSTAKSIEVVKRNGRRVPLDIDKIHQAIERVCDGLPGVSVSNIEMKLSIQLFEGITTREIDEATVKSMTDLITEDNPNYQYAAARKVIEMLRKEVLGQYATIPLYELVKKNTELGMYDPELISKYSDEEWKLIDSFIDHDRDNNFTYAGIMQLKDMYLVKNRKTGEIFETPQYAFILVAATLFATYPRETRLRYVKQYYDAISQFGVSLPTPVISGVRTKTKQFSSCVVIDVDDTLDSLATASWSVMKYVSQRAGIGLNVGRIRPLGSPIRNGEAVHTGITPYIQRFQQDMNAVSQGGLRKGSATLYVEIWHPEIETILKLKNNATLEKNAARFVDYAIQINELFYKRLIDGAEITLFSPAEIPGLYDAFFTDQVKFKSMYEEAERTHPKAPRLKAMDLFTQIMTERAETGRYYIMNVDHVNDFGPFDSRHPIVQSNLCVEIALPTKPLSSPIDTEGRIALCTLSASNVSKYVNTKGVINYAALERDIDLAVRGLDQILSYQNYPVEAARLAVQEFRPLGIGVVNFANMLAKCGMRYDESAFKLTHELFEALSYFAIKSSMNLAKQFGPCEKFHETRWAKGIMPIDRYKKSVDELVDPSHLKLDWNALRKDVMQYGMRNATLLALMPSETSSLVQNSTNGIEPPMAPLFIKEGRMTTKFLVPNVDKLKNKYQYRWDEKMNDGYIKIVAIMQKFVCQSISANTSYNKYLYENQKIPMSEMIMDILKAYKYGVKTLYYANSYITNEDIKKAAQEEKSTSQEPEPEIDDEDGCAGGACKI